MFAAIAIILALLTFAIIVQVSSGEIGPEAASAVCAIIVLAPAMIAFELLFKRGFYRRKRPEEEE